MKNVITRIFNRARIQCNGDRNRTACSRIKQIVLGVTGGIAAYKAVELLRLLTKAGADVHVIMTRSAQEFVTPLTFQTLSANPVHTELFNLIAEREIGHIALADRADLFIIAPATANVIGKIASGIADDMLTTTVMATKAPVLIAPAMNVNMYTNPIYRDNEDRLRRYGYLFVPPETGALACGWEGEGKLAAPESIFEAAVAALSPKDLRGQTIMITAGPTREETRSGTFHQQPLIGQDGLCPGEGRSAARGTGDPGQRPREPAGPLRCRTGPCRKRPRDAGRRHGAGRRMYGRSSRRRQWLITAPGNAAVRRSRKQAAELSLQLVKTPDILAGLGALEKRPFLVGFAAETGNLDEFAARKLKEKNADMIVANDVSQPDAGFNVDTNRARLFFRDGRDLECPLMSKDELAGSDTRSHCR